MSPADVLEPQVLDLSHNKGVSGSIPRRYGGFRLLRQLNLSHCNMTGASGDDKAALCLVSSVRASYRYAAVEDLLTFSVPPHVQVPYPHFSARCRHLSSLGSRITR